MYVVGPKYIYYTSEDSARKKIAGLCWCFVFCFIGAIIASIFWIVYEVKTAQDLMELRMIRSNLVQLPQGQLGVDQIQRNPGDYNGKIIYLGSVQLNPSMVEDPLFLQKKDCAFLQRFTEYCQWNEIEHTVRTVVGHNPDGSDIVQNIVSYDHQLEWRSFLINSDNFKNRSIFINPINFNLPGWKSYGTTVIGTNPLLYPQPLLVSGADLKLQSLQNVQLNNLPASNSDASRIYHFMAYTNQYYYSNYGQYPGADCVAGSVRVSYTSQAYYGQMSLIGKLKDRTLSKVEHLLLSEPGNMAAEDIIHKAEKDAYYSLTVARIFAIIFFCLICTIIGCYIVSRFIYLKNNQGGHYTQYQ